MSDVEQGKHGLSIGKTGIGPLDGVSDGARRVFVFFLTLALLAVGWLFVAGGWDDVIPIVDHDKYRDVKPTVDLVATAPAEINPQANADATLWQVLGHNVIGTWTRVDGAGKLGPELVDRWETSEDGLSWTFHLASGLKWSDGGKITADDLVKSLQANMKNGYEYADRLKASVENVAATDSSTVTITLGKPMAILPYLLGGRLGSVWPMAANADGTMKDGKMDSVPVTSGPYFLESFERTEDGKGTMVLGVSKGSQAKDVKNAQVTIRFTDEATANADAKAGKAQYAVSNANAAFPESSVRGSSTRRLALAFNGRTDRPYPALGDRRFRQGYRMGINSADVMNAIGGAYTGGQAIGGASVPGEVGYEDLTGMFPFDQAKGRWTATSYFGIYPIDVIIPDWAQAAGEVIKGELRGIDQYVHYEVLDQVAYAQRLQANDYDVALIEVGGYDGLKDYLDGNATTGVDAPDTTTAYDAIFTAKTDEELQASIKNAVKTQSDWSTLGWLAAAKTTVWSMDGWSKIPADLADVNLDLTVLADESVK